MANANLVQKLVDTNKRAIIKMTGTFDGFNQETNTIKVDVSSLALALNANGQVMSSNTHPKSLYRVWPTKIIYNVNIKAGYIKLHYDASSGDGTIAVLGPSFGKIDDDGLLHVNPLSANSNGDICITTMGAAANDSYTIILDIRKDSRDYDAGQTADPAAFNAGNWSIR